LTLPKNTILVVKTGSTAHGTGLPGAEDEDETAVFIEPPEAVLGVGHVNDAYMQRTQPNGVRSGPGDTDRQLYSLRKFLHLAAAGNPSIMLVFWAPVIKATPLGHSLRNLASAFVGRHILPRHRGYMRSQIERLKGSRASGGHGKRGSGRREDVIAEFGFDTKFAMHAARLGYQGIELVTTGRLVLPIEGEAGDWLRAVRRGEIALGAFFERVDALDSALGSLMADEQYRAGPDLDAINAFGVAGHLSEWRLRALGR